MITDSMVEPSFPTAIRTGARILALLTARGRDGGHIDSLTIDRESGNFRAPRISD
jgi:hypothetical protein